jgi:hypothetical protein
MSEAVNRWWAQHHRDSSAKWLTKSDPYRVLAEHRTPPFAAGSYVLDIGVGDGLMSRLLMSSGILCDCLDICDEAAADAGGVDFFTDPATLPPCRYSHAIAHLVCQHANDDTIRALFKGLHGALRSGGVVSVQYARGEDVGSGDEAECTGGVYRRDSTMRGLIPASWVIEEQWQHPILPWGFLRARRL